MSERHEVIWGRHPVAEAIAAGGRVLTVCATSASVGLAREAAYAGVEAIEFPDGFCRRDIGHGAP